MGVIDRAKITAHLALSTWDTRLVCSLMRWRMGALSPGRWRARIVKRALAIGRVVATRVHRNPRLGELEDVSG